MRPRISIASLIARAASEAGVPVSVILGPSRRRVIARSRQRAMADAWLAGWSMPQVGRAFGDRDHTTVLHAVRLREEGKI